MQFLRANYAKIVESIQARRIQVKLSIANQKPEERMAENIRNCTTVGMLFLQHCSQPLHPASTVPAAPVLLHFTHCCFCYNFWFLPILTLVIALVLVFFCNFIYTEHLYKPQSIQTQINSLHWTSTIQGAGGSFPAASFFHFLPFSFPFSRFPNTPLRMTTQRMFG